MKKTNLFLLFIIFCLIFIYSCSSSDNKHYTEKTLSHHWFLRVLNDKQVLKEKAGKQIPYLDLNMYENSVTGNTGCNDITGKVDLEDHNITFRNMSMTKMNCSDAEY